MIRPSSNPQDSHASPAREPMDHTPLPSIDLNQEDAAIIGALERAFTSTGFVLVHGHGIGPDQVAAMRRLLTHYFARPLTDKLAESITPENYRGYIPLGFFSANSNGGSADHYEGYKLHQEISAADAICGACALYGPNRWPRQPDQFRRTVLDYWSACDGVSQRLLTLVARMMAIDSAWFLSLFDYPLTNMTLLHYPPLATGQDGYGIHPHKDTDALTLLFPDPVGGLWLRPRDSEDWLEVEAPADTLVVNIGDLLELWSGGYFVSTPHKVVNRSGAERYSFPFFVVPRHDVVVKPLMQPKPGFTRPPVPVGPVSQEVWRTNWRDTPPSTAGFDLGTLSD